MLEIEKKLNFMRETLKKSGIPAPSNRGRSFFVFVFVYVFFFFFFFFTTRFLRNAMSESAGISSFNRPIPH